ncbi:hypothetical protein [Macrococcus armenti]|uniref:hypothetical protein n=1 Tax=Macrococcus armenti TaxID=2875764 RepID=UPI001CCEAAE5|nr:hypothetical protein [Macrococcus armenti]UBH08438.1 hypothetical protein LAU41_10740 [Macrococcus armenti]UBH10724.1 hypothetical protein LAU38_10940 [Macrococcus armenti]
MKKFSTVLITTAILTSAFAADAQADTITKKSLGEVNISTQTQAKKLLENLPCKFEIEKYSDQFHVQKVETDNKGY